MKKMMSVMVVVMTAIFIAGSVLAWDGSGTSGKGDKGYSGKKELKEEMKKELGLTPEQDKNLEAAKAAHRDTAKALREELKARKTELKDAISKPGTTRAQVEPLVNDIKALEAKITDNRIDGIFAVKAILTPEQFAKLEAMREKHMKERMEKHQNEGAPKDR